MEKRLLWRDAPWHWIIGIAAGSLGSVAYLGSWRFPEEMAATGQVFGAMFAALAALWAGLAFSAQGSSIDRLHDDRQRDVADQVSVWIEPKTAILPIKQVRVKNGSPIQIHRVHVRWGLLMPQGRHAVGLEGGGHDAEGWTSIPPETSVAIALADWTGYRELAEFGVEISFDFGGSRWTRDVRGVLMRSDIPASTNLPAVVPT